jgi:UDP:flavonoid glycosyltransferase YjiC (YdhE family)
LDFIPNHIFDPQEFIRKPELQAAVRSGGQIKLVFSLLRAGSSLLQSVFDEYWRTSEGAEALIAATFLVGIPDCAEKRGIPVINAPIQPLLAPTNAFPSTFVAPWGAREHVFGNRITHKILQFVFWSIFRAELGRWRLKMGLAPVGNYFDWIQKRNIPTVYGFSPSVLPVPDDWPDNHHVTGYWFLEESPGWQADPGLVQFLNDGPPPVYVGFGSMDLQNAEPMSNLIIQALLESSQRGILASGWGGLRSEKLPPTIHPVQDIPHSWLFPQTAGVVHHGGMGTTAAGLRAGVPAIILPVGGDQPFWADRLQRLGVGLRSASYFKITSRRRLVEDIIRVTSEPSMNSKAAVLGAKIRTEQGCEMAVDLIQKSLVNRV